MERLSPKGDKSIEAVPLGRMGDGGESISSSSVLLCISFHPKGRTLLWSIEESNRSFSLVDIERPSFVFAQP